MDKYKNHEMMVIKPKNFRDDHLEWIVIKDVKPLEGEYAFVNESFSPLLAFMELPDSDTFEKYNSNVAEFCNKRLWGTLSCTLIIPDKEMKEYENEIYKTVDELKYGSVSINVWAGQCYGNFENGKFRILLIIYFSLKKGRGIWGGYPGTGKPEDIQSGVDFIGNTYLLDNLNKTVARSPLVSDTHGVKDMGNAQLKVMSRVAHYNISPSTYQFSKILSGALAGL